MIEEQDNLQEDDEQINQQNDQQQPDSDNMEKVYQELKDILPKIEDEVRSQIFQQLKAEYDIKLKDMIAKTQNNALQEVNQIVNEIQKEAQSNFDEKYQELETRQQNLDKQNQNIEDQIKKEVEQKIRSQFEKEKELLIKTVVEEINDKGFANDIESKIKEKLRLEYDDLTREEILKREKVIKVNYKKKLDTEKKQIEEFYLMEQKAKIEKEKQLLEREKAELARLQSLKNIRLSKFEEEKKTIKQQIKEQEKKYIQIIENLQNQISQIKSENATLDCENMI